MSEELEIELEDDDTPVLARAYFNQIGLDEARRFMCLDAVRCFGAHPDKAVKFAQDFEKFLAGKQAEHKADLKVVK